MVSGDNMRIALGAAVLSFATIGGCSGGPLSGPCGEYLGEWSVSGPGSPTLTINQDGSVFVVTGTGQGFNGASLSATCEGDVLRTSGVGLGDIAYLPSERAILLYGMRFRKN